MYNEDKIFADALKSQHVLTPVPDSLAIEWAESGADYWFDNVMDGSSLVWIDVMMQTFRESFPNVQWLVDDPGTLYAESEEYEDAEESPFEIDALQTATDLSLERYSVLFDRLSAAGVAVVPVG